MKRLVPRASLALFLFTVSALGRQPAPLPMSDPHDEAKSGESYHPVLFQQPDEKTASRKDEAPVGAVKLTPAARAAQFPPGSCEERYYSLFKEPAKARALEDDAKNKDFEEALRIDREAKAAFAKSDTFRKFSAAHPAMGREWVLRLAHSRFIHTGGGGAYAQFVEGTGPEVVPGEKDLRGLPLRSIVKNGNVEAAPSVFWRTDDRTPATKTGKAFVLHHERAHLLNWAPETLKKCLTKAETAGARPTIDPTAATEKEKVFADTFYSAEKNDKHPAVTKDASTARGLLAKCESYQPAAPVPLDRLFLDRMERSSILEQLMKEREKRFQEMLEDIRKTKPEPKKKDGGSDTRQGWGTSSFVALEDCLKRDAATALALFSLIRRYRLPGLYRREPFPDQLIEIVPDFYAAELTGEELDRIEDPAARRQAAEDVLRDFPPDLYDSETSEALDYVGIKKTNDARMIGVVLKNPKFQRALRCTMSGNRPVRETYCGEP